MQHKGSSEIEQGSGKAAHTVSDFLVSKESLFMRRPHNQNESNWSKCFTQIYYSQYKTYWE